MTALAPCQPDCVIINADDFGYSKEINKAIIKSFERGIISSTSLLINMPGFADAVEQIHTNSLLEKNVGLHLNLVEGFPVSDPIKKQKRFCDNAGKFIYQRNRAVFSLSTDEKKAVELEITAQLDLAIKNGIKLSHVDSHHGIHTEWSISKIILNLLPNYNINKIRIARNMGLKRNPFREVYKSAFNSYLKYKKFKGVDFFGDVDDFFCACKKENFHEKNIEIMVHPVNAENGIIKDLDCEDIEKKLKPALERFTIKGYSEL